MAVTDRNPTRGRLGAMDAAIHGNTDVGERRARRERLLSLGRTANGFMPDDEGEALFLAALRAGAAFHPATFVEIGAWCGKSTVYLGAAAEETDAVLFSLDHHHGSEENQAGWEHHDPSLVDPRTGRIDTLPSWRRTIDDADLEHSVVGLVGDSSTVSGRWRTPVAFCFIDGGHGAEPAWNDYRGWAPFVSEDGWLAIHDVFADPSDGGRPPYEIWRAALDSGEFVEDGECGSLRVLRRTG
ncbi:MAG: class I SAM-dependent methyltransferase [Acidimicrobiales bacterium]